MNKNNLTLYPGRRSFVLILAAIGILGAAGCATVTSEGPMTKEKVFAVTTSNQLISFNAGQPGRLLSTQALSGMQANEKVFGIDYRVAKGQLYALGSSSRLYRIDTSTGVAIQIGSGSFAVPLDGTEFGFDFNPTVDRIRVVSDRGQNMRLHPETGAVIDTDPVKEGVQIDGPLMYATGDVNFGKVPGLVAAAYTYDKNDEKLTTNFAIDGRYGMLVTQGTREGKAPAVSPNTGQLYSVGSLGIGSFAHASFDIADVSNAAFIAVNNPDSPASQWYRVNLETGKAERIGAIGGGAGVVGIAIEP